MSSNHKNGHRNESHKKVRVAIVGVGNCASSLVQGVHYYHDASPKDSVPGLMHVDLGGYHISDIEFVAAFDIDRNKVGLDLGEAIYAKPNNTVRFADVPRLSILVPEPAHDPISQDLVQQRLPAIVPDRLQDRYLRPGMVVLDLGAHLGVWTLLAAARGCTVVAVEANPDNASLLRASVAANHFEAVHVVAAAVSGRAAGGRSRGRRPARAGGCRR